MKTASERAAQWRALNEPEPRVVYRNKSVADAKGIVRRRQVKHKDWNIDHGVPSWAVVDGRLAFGIPHRGRPGMADFHIIGGALYQLGLWWWHLALQDDDEGMIIGLAESLDEAGRNILAVARDKGAV